MIPGKRYLGDGAYVQFNGVAFVLTAENGITATDRIVLEPEVLHALTQFVDEVRAAIVAARDEAPS